jgi:hypothetical protein
MLEDKMSVWPELPALLAGREGELVSVSIDVDPRYLESLLEALARVAFPVNPQIYHDAEMVYLYADGREEVCSATLVEFPAFEGQLAEVRAALESFGFDPGCLQVTSMLAEIHAEQVPEPPPPGARYRSRYRRKTRLAR